MNVNITIDGKSFSVPEGLPVRKAAVKNGIYVPGICGHPYLPSVRDVKWSRQVFRGDEVIVGDYQDETAGDHGSCNLCLVQVEGKEGLVRACNTKAAEGMVVRTTGDDIIKARQEALSKILANHPHACLTCAQKEGCSLTECSSNVPEDQRCCILLNRCELEKIVDFIGLPDGTPKYEHEGFPKITDDFFFERDYNLCIGCLRCVRICRDVRGVDVLAATLKDGRVWVGTTEQGLLPDSYCRFCGACVEVCPTGALLDKPDSKPVLHGENAPCIDACPAGIDIPGYLRHIAIGDYASALNIIYDSVPFPGILGYVCFHPCESECKRSTLDDSIAICALKRFVYENAPHDQIKPLKKFAATGEKVALVGSGPAGLTAAFYLARAGHQVTLFEERGKPGGMLRYAIPEYRLPESVLDDELKVLDDLGVDIKTGMKLGEHFQLDDLTGGKYNAILIAIGANVSHKLGIPGEDTENVLQSLDFLSNVRQGKAGELFGKVVVIGGGNVAIDAAMTARRLGSDDVTMVCLEKPDEMPAHDWEIQQAVDEGIKVINGYGPAEFIVEKDKLRKIRFKRCTRVFDSQGKFNPRYNEAETTEIEADFALLAIGQQVGEIGGNIKTGPGNLIKVDPETMATNIPGVFAAGDGISGPASVIDAIASGRKAADAIDRSLGGKGIITDPMPDEVRDDPYLGRDENFHARIKIDKQIGDPSERAKSFDVIERSLTVEEAEAVALQCLRCNLRAMITPVHLPPDKWQPLNAENIAVITADEGVYQIADATKKVIKIVGTAGIKSALQDEVDNQADGALFCWEEDRMYSKRESELIQQHLQQYGEMPGSGGDDDLDDLY